MEALLYIGVPMLIIIGGVILFALCAVPPGETAAHILPYAVLTVREAAPSDKAYLEQYAAQLAWMDASVLHTVLLVYPDEREDVRALCEELRRQYDFFTVCSLGQAHALLDRLMGGGR
ncbi:MAG: hypothetical protein IJ055_09345 [Oscillospiraceae bacterium]|nr:hypothetical protein [Oscillospiraceae bacterium]